MLCPRLVTPLRVAARAPLVARCASPRASLFQPAIEAVRGTTNSLFNSFELRAAVGVLLAAGIFNGASLAYRAGTRARSDPDDESLRYVTLAICVERKSRA